MVDATGKNISKIFVCLFYVCVCVCVCLCVCVSGTNIEEHHLKRDLCAHCNISLQIGSAVSSKCDRGLIAWV